MYPDFKDWLIDWGQGAREWAGVGEAEGEEEKESQAMSYNSETMTWAKTRVRCLADWGTQVPLYPDFKGKSKTFFIHKYDLACRKSERIYKIRTSKFNKVAWYKIDIQKATNYMSIY